MPRIRCRNYNSDGSGGPCPRLGVCEYVHPSEPAWSYTTRNTSNNPDFNRSGPPGPRKSKDDKTKRCRWYEEDGTPIYGGCKRPQCSFIHPAESGWATMGTDKGLLISRKPDASTSVSGWRWGDAGNDEDDATSKLANPNKQTSLENADPWGYFGAGSAASNVDSNAEECGWGDSGRTGGWGSLTTTGGWGSSITSEATNSPAEVWSTNAVRWGSGATGSEGWGSSTTGAWGSTTTNDARNSLTTGESNTGTGGWVSPVTAGVRGSDEAKRSAAPGDAIQSTDDRGSLATTTGVWGSSKIANAWRSMDAVSRSSDAAKKKGHSTTSGWGSNKATGENYPTAATTAEFKSSDGYPTASGWGSLKMVGAEKSTGGTTAGTGWGSGSGWGSSTTDVAKSGGGSAATTSGGWGPPATTAAKSGSETTGAGTGWGSSTTMDTAKSSATTGGWGSIIGGRKSSIITGWGASGEHDPVPSSASKQTPIPPHEIRRTSQNSTGPSDSVNSPTIGQWGRNTSLTVDSMKTSSKFPSSLYGERPRSASVSIPPPSPSLTNTSYRSMTSLSGAKNIFVHKPKTREEKKELIQAIISTMSLGVRARTEQREFELKRDRWKKNMASDTYGHVSQKARDKLETVRDDLERQVRHCSKTVAAVVSDLAQLPICLQDDRLDLGINGELQEMHSQVKEVRQWLQTTASAIKTAAQASSRGEAHEYDPPSKRARVSVSEDPLADRSASMKQQLDHLTARLDDSEHFNLSEDQIWDRISGKLQKRLDEFVVEHREDDDSTIDVSVDGLLKQMELQTEAQMKFDARNAENRAELGKQANDVATVIYRQGHAETIMTEYLAEHTTSKRKREEMVAVIDQQDRQLEFLEDKIQTMTEQVKQLSTIKRPQLINLADLELRMQAHIDELAKRLKQDVSSNLGVAQRNIFAMLEEQQDWLARVIWPKLQRSLLLTDMMHDYFVDLSVPLPHNEVHG